jgi:hypothetical protein
MSTNDQEREKRVSKALQETLNTHGYGFHHAVLRQLNELEVSGKSNWFFEIAELPVEVHGVGTRIDFVLQRGRNVGGDSVSAYYMLAECKRANPKFSDWCFVRAPYTLHNRQEGYVVLDRARCMDSGIRVGPTEHFVGSADHSSYQIAVEVKRDTKGDRQGFTTKGAIEEGATQIIRGLNGMVEFLAANRSLFPPVSRSIALLPVIFTTAQLWCSGVDLSTADLHSGDIDLSSSAFQQKPWLLYDYTVSSGLKHTHPLEPKNSWETTISHIIRRDYIRTIAVVSATGVEDFLNWSDLLVMR